MKLADAIIAGVVLAVVMLIIVPLSTAVLDILLIINIAASIFVLLTALYIKEPLEISILPTILLILTLFRLALNVSSTKRFSARGIWGDVIATFGSFVIGKNLVVGLIVFVIIVAIQFIVITKGSERVAEVAARFTLDAMPGKQMAIDADLNTGAIDEATAKKRRTDIQREADFYGAMDGASKFIKGDAIIGIIITLVNVIGGLIIGVAMGEMELSDAVQVYTLATVGDGLVSQIPALLTSTSTGIVVTRSNSDQSFGANVAMQLFGKPYVMIMAGAILVVMSLIPGLPTPPMLFLPSCFLCSAILPSASRRKRKPKKSWIRHRRLQRKSGSRKYYGPPAGRTDRTGIRVRHHSHGRRQLGRRPSGTRRDDQKAMRAGSGHHCAFHPPAG
jgi:flagellar biosynthesis protein FlhA